MTVCAQCGKDLRPSEFMPGVWIHVATSRILCGAPGKGRGIVRQEPFELNGTIGDETRETAE